MIDTQTARQAQVYDALGGGKDHQKHDREVAAELLEIFPGMPVAIEANQAFLRRAVRSLTKAGLWQFIDLGSGFPHDPVLHDVADDVAPGSRFAYVDANPTVCCHLRALCRGDGVTVVQEDLRQIDTILDDPQLRQMISLRAPTVVICGAVFHFMPDEDVIALIGRLRARLAPGSCLVFSLGTSDGLPEDKAAAACELYEEQVGPLVLRTRMEIMQLLAGCALLPPGLVRTYEWEPDTPVDAQLYAGIPDAPHLYAGVAGFLPTPALTRAL